MAVIHLTNGTNIFLDGNNIQVKETTNNITEKKLWLEIYNFKDIVAVFPMNEVLYAEIRK